MQVWLKLFALCSIFVWYCPCTHAEEHIIYAAVIYRHGDRTPVNQFPTDPYRNESLWPVKFGELTNTGKQQHYALGKWLRTHYNQLVSEKFDPGEIYVRSSNVDRTLMSAMANLAGMYPPVGNSVWNPHLQWQPIPVHTLPQEEDEIISMNRKCLNYDAEYKRNKNSPEYKKRLQKYKELMLYLTQNAGYIVDDYDHILDIYSVLKIERLNNFTLPDWTLKVFPDQMAEPAGYSFTTETATPLMARLRIGPFLKEVTQNMMKMLHFHNSKKLPGQKEDLKRKSPFKLHIYSAHDLNIGSILNGLRLYDGKCPEYTSTILFELMYDDSAQTHFVRILYRNTTEIIEPMVLSIPGCDYHCPLDRFIKLYEDIIPINWEKECNTKFPLGLVVTCTFSLVLFISLGIYGCYLCKRTNKQNKLRTVNKGIIYPDIQSLFDNPKH